MKYSLILILSAAACSAASTATDEPATVLAGAYAAVSINGNGLPAKVANDGSTRIYKRAN